MSVTVLEAKTRSQMKKFVHFPNELYKHNKWYVPQVESMDLDTFNPRKNHAFDVCEAKFFLALDDSGKVVGRVAAIVNHAYNAKVDEPICRFGWLDFIEDIEVLRALTGAVEDFAREHSLRTIIGPEGFLEFDVAGVLVEGFDKYPTAYGKYNDPYYDPMMTSLGFSKHMDWVEYRVDISGFDNEKNHRMAGIVAQRTGLHQASVTTHKDMLHYSDGIFQVMNHAYADIYGYTELTPGQLDDLRNQFISQADPGLLSVILDEQDTVVAFMIWLPSLSKALQKARGRIFPLGWVHILKALRHNDTADTLLIGIEPRYKGKGLIAMFFDKVYPRVAKIGIKYLETTRELEVNNSVQNLSGKFPHSLDKRARCYSKTIEL